MRVLDWAANSNILAIGEGRSSKPGRFILYDVEKENVLQERILSIDACKVAPEYKSMMKSYLECYGVKFVDGGRKIVVLTAGNGGIETYDLEKWEKWRFARPNIGPPFSDDSEDNEEETEDIIQKPRQKGQVKENRRGEPENQLVNGGYHMTVWEDQKKGTIFYASLDGDAVRVWDVPMTKGNAS
jgi:hypothetical protein